MHRLQHLIPRWQTVSDLSFGERVWAVPNFETVSATSPKIEWELDLSPLNLGAGPLGRTLGAKQTAVAALRRFLELELISAAPDIA